MAEAKKKTHAKAEVLDAAARARVDAHAAVDAQFDRAEALASVPQKVIDPNEHAALLTHTGQKPERDLSDAPPPGLLGPHSETLNPVADPADVDTSVAGNEDKSA